METTIDYASDYGAEASDYQTTMAENPAATIDYDSLARGKLCPLKVTQEPMMLLQNVEPDEDALAAFAGGIVRVCAPGEPPRVEYIGGQCDGPRCAWYDKTAERCAALSIARNK